MAARRSSATPISRAPTARSIRTSARMRPDCGNCFIQFSFPGGIPSHASPECPGSIHEGGELGYSLSHSFGAVFDNPDLHRRLRGRRRRSGDRAAGHCMAFEQVPQSGNRRGGAADPAPQWLQDCQPDDPRPDHARGIGPAAARLWLDAVLCRGPRARADARGDGRDARYGGASRSKLFRQDAAFMATPRVRAGR